MSYKLGIDVGGTNTDAVILDKANSVVAKCKRPTTEDVSGGIREAVAPVL
jgi:N-methylhydantoinase A/oxoprolinase/acetone carboxylase beta subunit